MSRFVALFCGGRDFDNKMAMYLCMHAMPNDALIVHGGARGADSMAGHYAMARGLEVRVYEADWATHGKAAGPIRNAHMLEDAHPDEVFAFPTCGSKGTWDMIRRAVDAGVNVHVLGVGSEDRLL
jgi:hypothetical protein